MYAVKKVKVYSYAPKFNKFGFGHMRGASLAGEYHLREHDEQISWHWVSYGSGSGPNDSWIYRNEPKLPSWENYLAGRI